MSFILDALRKAEDRRGAPGPVNVPALPDAVPSARRRRARPVLPWIVGSVVAVAIVLAVFAQRGKPRVRSVAAPVGQPATATPVASNIETRRALPPVSTDVAVERPSPVVRSLQREADAGKPSAAPAAAAKSKVSPGVSETQREPVAAPGPGARGQVIYADNPLDEKSSPPVSSGRVAYAPAANAAAGDPLKMYSDVALESAELPRLHLDIHVFSDDPASRFVFVNMRKYREGDRVADDLSVERITAGGAVMVHRGQRFLLPRT